MKRKFLIHCFGFLFTIFFLAKNSSAQNFFPSAITPGINVGYIFDAGISLGLEINYTPFVFDSGLGKTATGIYAGLNYFHSKGEIYKETWYHTKSFGAIAFSDSRFMFKAGMSRTILPWGKNKMNKFKSRNRSIDIDLSYAPLANGAFIGYRLYFPGEACFGLDISTVNMLYTSFRYNFEPRIFDGPSKK
ncbi:MAG: hypothetical protein NT084_00010 [Bacteroidetes bacterium]|nr:hypothetical protein [Bacteroidota bacterium]